MMLRCSSCWIPAMLLAVLVPLNSRAMAQSGGKVGQDPFGSAPNRPETAPTDGDPFGERVAGHANDIEESESGDALDKYFDYTSGPSTVKDFIHALTDFFPPPQLNIIVSPEAANVSLPEMTFKGVKVRNALRLLSRLAPINVDEDEGQIDDGRVILIESDQSHETVTRAISVKHLLGKVDGVVDGEQLMVLFNDGFEFMQVGTSKPVMKLHEPTGLMFIKGSQSQVFFAMQIVSELSGLTGGTEGMMAPGGAGMPGMGGGGPGGMGMGMGMGMWPGEGMHLDAGGRLVGPGMGGGAGGMGGGAGGLGGGGVPGAGFGGGMH
jgi:hypothetical protein